MEMKQVNFRLVFVPEKNHFLFTVYDSSWELTEEEVKKMIYCLSDKTSDLTDAQTEFKVDIDEKRHAVTLKGKGSKNAFIGLVKYLNEVWISYLIHKKGLI
jgi:hypothetical protein